MTSDDVYVRVYLEHTEGCHVTSIHPGVYSRAYLVQMVGLSFILAQLEAGTIRAIDEVTPTWPV